MISSHLNLISEIKVLLLFLFSLQLFFFCELNLFHLIFKPDFHAVLGINWEVNRVAKHLRHKMFYEILNIDSERIFEGLHWKFRIWFFLRPMHVYHTVFFMLLEINKVKLSNKVLTIWFFWNWDSNEKRKQRFDLELSHYVHNQIVYYRSSNDVLKSKESISNFLCCFANHFLRICSQNRIVFSVLSIFHI